MSIDREYIDLKKLSHGKKTALKRYLFGIIAILITFMAVWVGSERIKSSLVSVAMGTSFATAQVNPGDHIHTISVNGTERQYIVHVPSSYSPTAATAVVLNFHGGGSNANRQMVLSRMNETSDAYGFLVVYPEGTKAVIGPWRTWNAGSCCGRAMRDNVDDVQFSAAIIDDLDRKYSIDKRRVFATGMSNGAMMAYRLACELSNRIAAIAPVGATIGVDHCRPSRPVSVLHFHGTADKFAPYRGGYGKIWASDKFKSVADTIAIFVVLNGCGNQPVVSYQKGDVTCLSYPSCKDKSSVVLCPIENGGHTWPGGPPLLKRGGKTSYDVSASEAMWKFFEAHPLPENIR
jgi:polyhydroxybutyrate depolymerase